MNRLLKALVIVGVLTICSLRYQPAIAHMIVLLGVGWVVFLGEVVPNIPFHRSVVATGVCSLVIFVLAVHWFVAWFMERTRGEASTILSKWRWTANLASGMVLLIVGGIAAAGGASQFTRMITSEEPWLRSGRSGHSRRLQSMSNLRQVGIGLNVYRNEYARFPPGATFGADGTPLHGWPTLILPYADNIELYNGINFAKPWDDPENRGDVSNQIATATGIGIYKNPGVWDISNEKRLTAFGYASNAWIIGGDKSWRASEITDGLAQTLLGGEAAGDYKPWGSPIHWRDPNLGINRSASGFGSPFPGGANFLFGDGSVKFLRNQIPMPLFRALATPNGGEHVEVEKLD